MPTPQKAVDIFRSVESERSSHQCNVIFTVVRPEAFSYLISWTRVLRIRSTSTRSLNTEVDPTMQRVFERPGGLPSVGLPAMFPSPSFPLSVGSSSQVNLGPLARHSSLPRRCGGGGGSAASGPLKRDSSSLAGFPCPPAHLLLFLLMPLHGERERVPFPKRQRKQY